MLGECELLYSLGVFNSISEPFANVERRTEFEKGVALDKKDFSTIEYLLRRGERQLSIYSAAGIKDIR